MNPLFICPETIYEALGSVPGVEYPLDGNGGFNGVFWYPVSVDPETRQRSYSRTAHWDGLERGNYDLLTGCRVNEIVLDEDNVATGVRFVPRGEEESYVVEARREVVLSAGAIHTPQVLQLSGIGPAAWLEAAGVEVRVDLPGVGANFQDHPIGPNIGFSCKCRIFSASLCTLT
ncbi:GMC family oxidoreductase N-terminal domain-containing protein [Candidatus Bathyarchaeota archaeon]|nr:GMC family oxidoreductase N-terminal domain-containing protein [Candidatus Bathyarchaeota archaeon]